MSVKKLHCIVVSALVALTFVAPTQIAVAATEGDYTYAVRDGAATIERYSGAGGDVLIPAELGGVPVVKIGDLAFSHCSSITSVSIPSSVVEISSQAFYMCSGLTSVNIPVSVWSIGSYAFGGCSSLTNLAIPTSVTDIDTGAFSGCSSLTSLVIPASVTDIGDAMFSGCSSLTSVNLPANVTSIERLMFRGCSSLTDFAIPGGVTSIGYSAFEGCSSLTSLVIPDQVTYFEYNAFKDCSSLTEFDLPDTVTEIGDGVFDGCSSLTHVVIPGGVTSIGYFAFRGCSSLGSLVIPYGVTRVGGSTFEGCSGLTSVTIPEGVTSIGRLAFKGCSSLTEFHIPDTVTEIGDGAFDGCGSLTDLVVPDGVTTIQGSTFRGCSSLTEFVVPDGVTGIYDRAFQDCTGLAGVTIPGAVTFIGYEAFANCSSLTSVTIPASVTVAAAGAFKDCRSLRSAKFLGNAPTYMSETTFANCADDFIVYYIPRSTGFGHPPGPWFGYRTAYLPGTVLTLTVTSIAGSNRITTAIESSRLAFPSGGTDHVVIATARNWPDALGGAALAGALDAPILLTEQDLLPAVVAAEIDRLGARNVIILGGTGAVSDVVKAALVDRLGAAHVERIGGATRYETASKVASRTISALGAGYDGTAFIATGKNFPDALGASPLAAKGGWPIYLYNPELYPTVDLLLPISGMGVKRVVILGGPSVVPTRLDDIARSHFDAGYPDASRVTRLYGNTRYDTAAEVAAYGVKKLGLSYDGLAIATGANFPDALAGGVLQGKSGSVMLLTPTDSLADAARVTLAENKEEIFEVRFLGGAKAISLGTRASVAGILEK